MYNPILSSQAFSVDVHVCRRITTEQSLASSPCLHAYALNVFLIQRSAKTIVKESCNYELAHLKRRRRRRRKRGGEGGEGGGRRG